jgi:hypothetical protein
MDRRSIGLQLLVLPARSRREGAHGSAPGFSPARSAGENGLAEGRGIRGPIEPNGYNFDLRFSS